MSKYDNDYEKTGCIAIDMVASCVAFYRNRHGIEPAKIEMKPHYYDMMRKGIEVLAGKELDWSGGMKFEGIPIERGPMSMLNNMRTLFHGTIPKGIIAQA